VVNRFESSWHELRCIGILTVSLNGVLRQAASKVYACQVRNRCWVGSISTDTKHQGCKCWVFGSSG
ncbi:MAG: hypothetical protein V7L23_10725, partial [Nostoc sp.]|uniref:hypothetical protein n=1 Tax=Nostoc sp. TaxID=1180 RepID=UPI002FF1E026